MNRKVGVPTIIFTEKKEVRKTLENFRHEITNMFDLLLSYFIHDMTDTYLLKGHGDLQGLRQEAPSGNSGEVHDWNIC